MANGEIESQEDFEARMGDIAREQLEKLAAMPQARARPPGTIGGAQTPLEQRCERLEAQLAGCGAAALGCEVEIPRDSFGWSASYADVLRLRVDFEALARVTGKLLASNPGWEGKLFGSDEPLPDFVELEMFRDPHPTPASQARHAVLLERCRPHAGESTAGPIADIMSELRRTRTIDEVIPDPTIEVDVVVGPPDEGEALELTMERLSMVVSTIGTPARLRTIRVPRQPVGPQVTSCTVDEGPAHDHVHVWIDHKKSGVLTVGCGEGKALRALLWPEGTE